MIILALDPGAETGWAVADVDLAKGSLSSFKHVRRGLIAVDEILTCGCGRDCRHCEAGIIALVRLVEEYKPDVLVLEDFTLHPGSQLSDRKALSPVRVTSQLIAVLAWSLQKPKRIVTNQSAANAKGKATDVRLKKSNLWIVGKKHGRDAVRHLVLFVDRELSK